MLLELKMRTNIIKCLSLLIMAILIQSCNPAPAPNILVDPSTDLSSRLPIDTNEDNKPKDIALCNWQDSDLIKIRLMVYYDQYGYYHPDLLRIYIPEIHPDFQNSVYQIQLRKWKASPSGETYQDDTPMKVWVEKLNTKTPMTTAMNGLQWASISGELQKTLGTIPEMADTFSKYSFVVDLKDPTASYDVLKFSVYKDGVWMKDWNILMPAFYANPATYAEKQNGVLAKMHPFYGQESSSFAKDFVIQFNGYCF